MNPRMRVLQTLALPLGYVAMYDNAYRPSTGISDRRLEERAMGFEPTTSSLARKRSTAEPRPRWLSMLLGSSREPTVGYRKKKGLSIHLPLHA